MIQEEQMTPQVLLPVSNRNMRNAEFRPGAVLEAVAILEIQKPVEIKWAGGYSRHGSHRAGNGKHVITISTRYDAEAISQTLWHELVHCNQAERFESEAKFSAAYRRESVYRGYDFNKFEVEARELAEDFASDLPLAR
jgi:hypothetical protein